MSKEPVDLKTAMKMAVRRDSDARMARWLRAWMKGDVEAMEREKEEGDRIARLRENGDW